MNRRMRGMTIALATVLAAAACTDAVPVGPTGPSALDLVSMSADAQPQPNVTITVYIDHIGGSQATWIATGAFTDNGVVEPTDFDVRGGPPIFTPGHVFAKAVLRSDRGTFVIDNREHFNFNILAPDPRNTWVAERGTGFYEGLTGQGTYTVTHQTETALGQVVNTGYVRL